MIVPSCLDADVMLVGFIRYVSSKTDESSSLFFSSGTTFEEYAEGGHYRMTKADKRYDAHVRLL